MATLIQSFPINSVQTAQVYLDAADDSRGHTKGDNTCLPHPLGYVCIESGELLKHGEIRDLWVSR